MTTQQVIPDPLDEVLEKVKDTHIILVIDLFVPVPTPLDKPQQYHNIPLYVGPDAQAAYHAYNEFVPATGEVVVYIHRGNIMRLRSVEESKGILLDFFEVPHDGTNH